MLLNAHAFRGTSHVLLALALLLGILLPQTTAVTRAATSDQGEWGSVLDWGIQGKHMVALPTGNVLVWSTGDNARVWDV